MPFVEVYTRERIADDVRETLADALIRTMTEIEVGSVTDASLEISMVWFHTLGETGWVTGGRLDATHRHGRHSVLARVVAPEAFLDAALRERAIREVTADLRAALAIPASDDGRAIHVIVQEIPDGLWGVAGASVRLQAVMDMMPGHVSAERKAEMTRHFDGQEKLRRDYGIPG